jgi:hypothetical protein
MYCFFFCVPLGSCYEAVPEEQQCIHTHIRVQSCMYVCMYVCTRHAFIQTVPGTMGSCFCYLAWV